MMVLLDFPRKKIYSRGIIVTKHTHASARARPHPHRQRLDHQVRTLEL